jgi:cytochrome c553
MSFRSAGFRNAVLGSATALAFALATGVVMAQAAAPKPVAPSSKTPAPAVASTAAQLAPASTSAAAPNATAPASASSANTAAETAAVKPGDVTAGQAKAAVCGACHGIDGNSSDPQYPKLAGQGEAYIAHQLASFKAGKRQNPIMLGMATPLSPQDMQNVGAYFATKTSLPGVADQALVEHGQTLFREGDATRGIPACMACHSMDGRGNPGAMYPQLAGQHAQYIQATLKAWHDGTVWGTDAHSQIMPAIAQKLDANDIAALASYVEGLHSAAPQTAPETP